VGLPIGLDHQGRDAGGPRWQNLRNRALIDAAFGCL
jgi:hypothetical protein